jgi:RNA polymerase sigma-70 factor (ECF subfamily)
MNLASESDEWLMGQVAQGRRECLETLVRRYASPLLTYIERMVGNHHQAEELFQDVFLAVWTKRRTYRFPSAFRSWLYTIATNRCRQAFRKARTPEAAPAEKLAEMASVAADASPVEAAVATETAQLVSVAVAQLPPQQRTVLVLRNWNGLSYAEIAHIVGRTEATVRSHVHHALANIRRYLEPRLPREDDD